MSLHLYLVWSHVVSTHSQLKSLNCVVRFGSFLDSGTVCRLTINGTLRQRRLLPVPKCTRRNSCCPNFVSGCAKYTQKAAFLPQYCAACDAGENPEKPDEHAFDALRVGARMRSQSKTTRLWSAIRRRRRRKCQLLSLKQPHRFCSLQLFTCAS